MIDLSIMPKDYRRIKVRIRGLPCIISFRTKLGLLRFLFWGRGGGEGEAFYLDILNVQARSSSSCEKYGRFLFELQIIFCFGRSFQWLKKGFLHHLNSPFPQIQS